MTHAPAQLAGQRKAMQTEIHCTCGATHPIEPDQVQLGFQCPQCGSVQKFRERDDDVGTIRWLLVGVAGNAPYAAVPIPRGETLKVGRDRRSWLQLEDKAVDAAHAEIRVEPPAKITVKNLSTAAGTWINRCKIYTGVLGEQDEMRIGGYRLAPASHVAIAAGRQAEVSGVVIETDESDHYADTPDAESNNVIIESDDPMPVEIISDEDEKRDLISGALLDDTNRQMATRRWMWIGLLAVVILGSLGWYLKSNMFAAVSADMPVETEYRCPIDGTAFRAAWSREPPACPKCGSRAFGMIAKRMTVTLPSPSSAPASQKAAESQPSESESGSDE